MSNKELFLEVVKELKDHGISMEGTLVCLYGEPIFNIEGFNFAYNLVRLGKLVNEVVDFR